MSVDQLRALGLAMGSHYAPHTFTTEGEDGPIEVTRQTFIGWTTDEAKAREAEALGATLREYRSKDRVFSGWEVIVHCRAVNRRARKA